MKKIIKNGENGQPDVVVETDGRLWNFSAGDVIRQNGNPRFSYEVLGFRYGEQLWVKSTDESIPATLIKESIFYFESPAGLILLSRPGTKFKAGDQVKIICGVFAGETGKIAVIDPEAANLTVSYSYLVEFDFNGQDGQTGAEASWDKPWFPKEHKFIRKKYFWASENDMEGVMKRVIRARDGREIEVETEGELWGFKTDDVIIDENDDEDKRLVIQGFRKGMIWVCGINSGYARPLIKPDGLLLVERPGLKFAAGDTVRITSGNGKDSIGTIAVIDPHDAAKELNNKPAHPYYVEIDFPDNDGYEAKRMENPWYPKKRKTNKQRIMCGDYEIEKCQPNETEINADKTRIDADAENNPAENSVPMKNWPNSLKIADGAPEWLKETALKIKAGVSHFFILWGNIYDLQKINDTNTRIHPNDPNQKENVKRSDLQIKEEVRPQGEQKTKFIPLERCLIEILGNNGNPPTGGPVMFYSISKGLYFDDSASETRFRGRYIEKKAEKVPQKPHNQMSETEKLAEDRERTEKEMPLAEILGGKGPDKVFPFLEKFVLTEKSGPKILVIDFGHNVAPAETGTNDRHDRETIETLEYWARDKKIREAGGIIILLTPHLVDVADSLRAPHSGAAAIHVPKPNEEERTSQWESLAKDGGVEIKDNLDAKTLGRITNGMSLNQIIAVYSLAKVQNAPLDLTLIRNKKQEILETEFGERIKITIPKFGFSFIGGMENFKDYHLEMRDNILKGQYRRVPMGIMASGPPGTGKTFFFECFAYECGFNFVKIVNPQEMWVGASERNMAKILSALDDVSPVIVIEDEADQSEAPRGSPVGDSGVSNHLRQMKFEFCSDPKRRGKVIWVRLTNRPDLIDAAYKRKGRTDDHIAFGMPDAEACAKIFAVIFKRYEIPTNIDDFSYFGEKAAEKTYCTGGDIEWMVLEADKLAGREGKEKVGKKHLLKKVDEWAPTTDPNVIDHQLIISHQYANIRPNNWKEIIAAAKERMAGRRNGK